MTLILCDIAFYGTHSIIVFILLIAFVIIINFIDNIESVVIFVSIISFLLIIMSKFIYAVINTLMC